MDQIIGIGCDHAGYELKEYLKENLIATGRKVKDFGIFKMERADYPDIAHPLAHEVNTNQLEVAVIICGTGNGVAITANKYLNVRAALCWNTEIAAYARKHNDANILALPARFLKRRRAWKILRKFLSTNFEGGRHAVRVEKIKNILN
ncbi:MAG TPA: ribose 5-phosphate isomerase B [Bacteroidales bacterium]|nr:ribose 5-phosphate isomerase B [Bacteroidales bacterium]